MANRHSTDKNLHFITIKMARLKSRITLILLMVEFAQYGVLKKVAKKLSLAGKDSEETLRRLNTNLCQSCRLNSHKK